MSFREVADSILSLLRTEANILGLPATNIEYGKFGIMPAASPFIWIYLEPLENEDLVSAKYIRRGKTTIFCGVSRQSQYEAILDAIELSERVWRLLFERISYVMENVHIGFDHVYADYAVSYIEFEFEYTMSEI